MKKISGADIWAAACAVGVGALTWILYSMGKSKGAADAYCECGNMLKRCIEARESEKIDSEG